MYLFNTMKQSYETLKKKIKYINECFKAAEKKKKKSERPTTCISKLPSLSLGSAGLEATLSIPIGLNNEESPWSVR